MNPGKDYHQLRKSHVKMSLYQLNSVTVAVPLCKEEKLPGAAYSSLVGS